VEWLVVSFGLTFKSVWWAPLFISLCLAGCDSQATFPVRGRVVYSDGSSLPTSGKVVFESVQHDLPISAIGFFEKDGNFELTKFKGAGGVVAGDYKVAVVCNVPDDRGQLSPQEYQRVRNAIDRRFTSPRSSPLRFTVSAETAPHEFQIKVDRPKRR
jgi:hypothetical protein